MEILTKVTFNTIRLYLIQIEAHLTINKEIQGIFLLCADFDQASCLHFLSDLVHRPLIFFGRWDAIEWGIDDNFIITPYRVISQCVKDIFLRKKDRFFEILPQKEEKSYSSDTKFLKSFAFYALKEPVKFEVNRRMSCG